MDTSPKRTELSKLLFILEDVVLPEKLEEHVEVQRQKRERERTQHPRRYSRVFASAKNPDLRMWDYGEPDYDRKVDISENEVKKALLTLKDKDQTIIKLRFGLDGATKLKYREIATVVGMSESGVKRAVKRILRQSGYVVKST